MNKTAHASFIAVKEQFILMKLSKMAVLNLTGFKNLLGFQCLYNLVANTKLFRYTFLIPCSLYTSITAM